LQRFADGDRVGAWPVLEALRIARRAVRWREDEALRDIMRVKGEATAADTLQLWDEAARLDPKDFWTHIYRVRLALPLGLVDKARDAADLAVTVAQNLRARSVALDELGRIQQTRDPDAALRAYEESLRISRDLLAKEPGNVERLRDVWVSRWRLPEAWSDVLSAMEEARGRGFINGAQDECSYQEAKRRAASELAARGKGLQ
jgi:tetratricopeptide (TPR) repeat protein